MMMISLVAFVIQEELHPLIPISVSLQTRKKMVRDEIINGGKTRRKTENKK